MHKPPLTDLQVLEHARLAALYYRALVNEGVGESSAAAMASMYVAGLIARQEAKPAEPWESEDGQ